MAQKAAKAAGGLAAKLPQLANTSGNLAQRGLQAAQKQGQVFWRYARVELTPPSAADLPQIQKTFNQVVVSARSGAWKKTPMKEAVVNAVVCAEVACWFFIGECIGKRSLVGYNIPGACDFGMHL